MAPSTGDRQREPAIARLAGGPIHYTLRRSPRSRGLRLVLHPDRGVVVTVPAAGRRGWANPDRQVHDFHDPRGRADSGSVRDQRTRWGSDSRYGRLAFSWRLVFAPPEALETVVIHELAHLRVFGHGPRFWSLVAARRPDHAIWRRWLRNHSTELHGALAEIEPAVADGSGPIGQAV